MPFEHHPDPVPEAQTMIFYGHLQRKQSLYTTAIPTPMSLAPLPLSQA